jgi:flagellar motor protein MotB
LENKVVVEGYTDARPYVSSGYSNWDLSTDRANSARKIMEANGLRKNQVSEVRGFADRKLRVPEKPHDYVNRRVSILMTPIDEQADLSQAGPQGFPASDPDALPMFGKSPMIVH